MYFFLSKTRTSLVLGGLTSVPFQDTVQQTVSFGFWTFHFWKSWFKKLYHFTYTVDVRKRYVPFGKLNTFVFGLFGSTKLDRYRKKLYIKWSSFVKKMNRTEKNSIRTFENRTNHQKSVPISKPNTFCNRTIYKSDKIETFGFQTLTVFTFFLIYKTM